ncbi:nucleotide disphospho-sugar-binding domain-containing protein [Gordonia terrae]|uniref:Glycosyltransferase n=2 Tax=Gordonia terrae TaxID=2055 RepID=A0AAD0K4R6_9ACTN|nr:MULTISPECIES: nucleotide disphospho-sugar-binding domain-containing protein [Gordonia]VTR09725.1 sterol 3-beta-glucosyltransferase [Clostridioides difficile]ANY22319.1 glycosyl transferase [Gordonia terrae]AWO83058.1 glycosyltransferase [Gordonia terrae]VTS32035.1 Glycosyl transferases, related to UDP-glucuronosyltransferase [Gordonia terrae]GAB44045.1 putative glycosyltransferase [Gordonia terrae NBRC 100016]
MRFAFAVHGSRGDIQPAIALGAELTRRGHEVRLAVPEDLVTMTAASGLPTQVLAPSTAELLASPLVKERLKSKNPRVRLRALGEVAEHGRATSERVMAELADASDLLLTGPLAQDRGEAIAQSRGIPFVPLHYCPLRPNGSLDVRYRPYPRPVSRAMWLLADRTYWLTVRGADRRLRDELGLPAAKGPLGSRLRARGVPEIQAYDAALFGGLAAEWGTQRPLVGFLLPDTATRHAMSAGTDATGSALDWIADGEPPVYVGFGSMKITDEQIAGIVTTLLGRGLRVIGHTEHELPQDDRLLHVAGPVDHEVLLPRCRGAVHHGGAGTTAAATRAGIPSVIAWLSADQPMWAAALRRANAGAGNRLARFGPDDLDPLTDPAIAAGAARLARRLTPPAAAVDRACDILLAAAG